MSADPAAIESLAYNVVLPAHIARHGWTGTVEGCNPGSIPSSKRALALAAINAYRQIEGLDPVLQNPAFSDREQAAALIMAAEGELSHTPPPTWACWTQLGADGASQSNLTINTHAVASLSYMDDGGDNNHAAGHRYSILSPGKEEMSIGLTSNTGALYMGGYDSSNTTPEFVAWPPAGYFPSSLEPSGRWSLLPADLDTDFRTASVSMSGPDGPLHVTTWNPPYIGAQVVWDALEVPQPEWMTGPVTLTVRVSGWIRAGVVQPDLEYATTLLPPRPLTSLSPPTITGDLRSGDVLTATKGTWAKTAYPLYFTYRWYVDGQPIPGRRGKFSTLLLQPEQEGNHTIQVRVTAALDDGPDTRWWRTGTAYGTVQGTIGKGRLTSLHRPVVNQLKYRELRVLGTQWNLPVTRVKYHWTRDGKPYVVTIGKKLVLERTDHGHRFRVTAVARSAGYGRAQVRSKTYFAR